MFPFLIFENVFDQKILKEMVDSISKCEFKKSPNNNSFESLQLEKKINKYSQFDQLTDIVSEIVRSFYKKEISFYTGKSIARYTEGRFIGMHRDWEPLDPYVLENNKPRIDLASIVYLNDDYVGGEIKFYNSFKSENPYITIKPKSGMCILFDSGIYHVTNPIISGTKYSYTTFYQLGE